MAAIGGVVVGFKVDLNPLGLLDCSTARIETAGSSPSVFMLLYSTYTM